MGSNFIWEMFTLRIIVIIIILLIVITLLYISKSMKFEKRITNFALSGKKDNEITYFDAIGKFFLNKICSLAKFFERKKWFTKKSKKYLKYISYKEALIQKGSEYIAIKWYLAILFPILYALTLLINRDFNSIGLVVSFLLGYYILDIYLNIMYRRKQLIVEDDLLEAITMMNNCFKAGKNIMQAITFVKDELKGPIAEEFNGIYLDLKYGLDIESAFIRFYKRIKIADAKYIATSLSLLNKTGGNIVTILSRIEQTMINNKKIRSELRNATAGATFVYRILIFLPIIFVIIITLLNNSYFLVLFQSIIGMLILVFILLLYSFYIVLVNRIMRVRL